MRDTHRPCTTPNCDGARYVDELCKPCWHAQTWPQFKRPTAPGRVHLLCPLRRRLRQAAIQAADGAGDGAALQVLDDHPSPAPALSPEVQEHERQRLHDLAEDYMREAAEEADDKRRAAAPSLTMDLCSDIPEGDR